MSSAYRQSSRNEVLAGILTLLWEKSMTVPVVGTHCAIPRSIRFAVKGEQLLVFGLESGIMCVQTRFKGRTRFHCDNRESKVSATGVNDWSKTLNSSMYE